MVDQITIQTLGVLVAASGVLIGVAYYIVSIRNQVQTRQAQLFMNLYNVIQNKDFYKRFLNQISEWEYKDYNDFETKYGFEANPEENTYWHLNTNFLESISILVNRGLVPIELVHAWLGNYPILHWEKYRPYIVGLRERIYPDAFIENERFYNRLVEYRRKHPATRGLTQ
jgi:hypothetical protein